jgi:hypothetical protein
VDKQRIIGRVGGGLGTENGGAVRYRGKTPAPCSQQSELEGTFLFDDRHLTPEMRLRGHHESLTDALDVW